MCGIVGAGWHSTGEPLSEEQLHLMLQVLQHRGPDDQGCHTAQASQMSVALGQRRLSIIDLDGGHQPLANEDDSIWITFNGEIYNYRELRPQLQQQGHRFRTDCDTEVIVHLYEQYGTDCVQHLRGMFAFAIWDANKQQLFLARDRLGQKPLYFRKESNRLLFASELKALLQVPNVPREINPAGIDQFLLYQYVPHPNCMLKGFQKLPPAHWARFSSTHFEIQRYWSPPYQLQETTELEQPDERRHWTPSDWQQELRKRLTESVRLRLRSDVPLGAFLSGGIDSTIIVGLMQQLTSTPVHSFSIGFPVAQFDERSYAREAAEKLGTMHHEQIVEPNALEILPRLIWQYDEPYADSSAIPTWYLSEMTRNHVKVALSGDGGDELFAGYDRYKAVRIGTLFDRLPGPVRKLLTTRLWQRIPASVEQKSFRRRFKRLLSALADPPEKRYARWIGIFDQDMRHELYTPEFQEQIAGIDAMQFLYEAYEQCPARDFVTRTTCTDLLTYLPCDILTKVDIASMTHSLECRSPFLDHHVVELAAQMPVELKQSWRQGKRILIETFRDLLPTSIQQRKKMGFGVPLNHWFRAELKPLLYDVVLSDTALHRGYFRRECVDRLVSEHVTGKRDHSYRLWALLCFEAWQRIYLDPASIPHSAPAAI